jgi:hypothetical protein
MNLEAPDREPLRHEYDGVNEFEDYVYQLYVIKGIHDVEQINDALRERGMITTKDMPRNLICAGIAHAAKKRYKQELPELEI